MTPRHECFPASASARRADRERQEFLRAYYACTSYMDAQVGRVLDTLDRLHHWENTIFIFLGDNGYHLGERNWWNKDTLFERSCHAPLLIASPGVNPGVVRDPSSQLSAELAAVAAPHAPRP